MKVIDSAAWTGTKAPKSSPVFDPRIQDMIAKAARERGIDAAVGVARGFNASQKS